MPDRDINDGSITTAAGRLKSGPGGSYLEFVQAPRFAADRFEKFGAIIFTHQTWTLLLAEQGVIPVRDALSIHRALLDLERQGHAALGVYQPHLEDLYMHVERFLANVVGADVVGQINFGRTRPEPFNRLVGREKLLSLIDEAIAFHRKMLDKAGDHLSTLMPGYTHMQQAQPMTAGHYLLAVADLVERSLEALALCYRHMNLNPLGCGALAGTRKVIDRGRITGLMGFDGLVENAYDAVSSADHFSRAAGAAAALMASLSRVAQDFNLWCTEEFRIAYVGDEFAATSSMMPQKRNAVCWEFIRARASSVVGMATEVLSIIQSTFYADVCDTCIEVAGPTWRALDTTGQMTRLLGDAITSVRFQTERMEDMVRKGFSTISELAEAIRAKSGLPYRVVHRLCGQTVSKMIERKMTAEQIDREVLNETARLLGLPKIDLSDAEIRQAVDPVEFVRSRDGVGGTAPAEGRRMLDDRQARLRKLGDEQAGRRRTIELAVQALAEGWRRLEAAPAPPGRR
jgi:argininosuccinate lyase